MAEAIVTDDITQRTEETAEEEASKDLNTDDSTGCEATKATKMSKRAMKRQKRKEKWEEIKLVKRAKERERKKQRKRAALERGEDIGPSRKTLKHNKMALSKCKMRVVLDCSFDRLMIEKDVCRLVKQIQRIYAINRRAENPVQFYLTSLGDKTREKLDSFGDYKSWDIYYDEKEYTQLFDNSDIVYLTSESPNVLTELDQSKAYIIGGLVDHNFHKGLCHDLAVKKGISHAQLPIGEFVQMKTRKVLTVDQVFEILVRFTEVNSWEKALLSVIPIRKGATSKNSQEKDSCEDNTCSSNVQSDEEATETHNKLSEEDNSSAEEINSDGDINNDGPAYNELTENHSNKKS